MQSAAGLLFFERALPTALVPNRDVGVQVLGDLHGGMVSYAAGVMNGVPDGGSADLDTNDGKDLAGRIVVRPFGPASKHPRSGLMVAFARDHRQPVRPARDDPHHEPAPDLHRPTLDATADGRLQRYSPQASYFFGRVAALAEYVHTSVPVRRGSVRADVANDAWQLAGSLVLTRGDVATERGVRPQHNFDFGAGHLGALQIGGALPRPHHRRGRNRARPGVRRLQPPGQGLDARPELVSQPEPQIRRQLRADHVRRERSAPRATRRTPWRSGPRSAFDRGENVMRSFIRAVAAIAFVAAAATPLAAQRLLNVSYDPDP